jgi:hypothetical protein
MSTVLFLKTSLYIRHICEHGIVIRLEIDELFPNGYMLAFESLDLSANLFLLVNLCLQTLGCFSCLFDICLIVVLSLCRHKVVFCFVFLNRRFVGRDDLRWRELDLDDFLYGVDLFAEHHLSPALER